MPKCCTIEGCTSTHYARGVCKPHYRNLPDQQAKDREYERTKRTTEARLEQERQRNQRRRSYINTWQQHQAMPRWAREWEERRRAEDVADLATIRTSHGRAARPLTQRPQIRRFIGHRCQACSATWVSYAAMPDAPYCKPCNRERWGGNHRQRARRYGVPYEYVKPEQVFERDNWTCQLCHKRTKHQWPHPRSATLDHIIPLFHGGSHTASNLQCACLACNSRKGARAANDQLLLAV